VTAAIFLTAARAMALEKPVTWTKNLNKTVTAAIAVAPQAAPQQGLHFVNFTLGPIGLGCSRTHSVTMCNSTAKPITNGQYVVNYWSRTGAAQPWAQYFGGWFAHDFAPGETKSFQMYFNIPHDAADIRVTVNPDHTLNSPVVCEVVVPALHLPLDKVVLTGLFTPVGWAVIIANNSSMYFCSDNVAAYKSTTAAPDAWVPCGGTVPPEEIAPGARDTTLSVNPGVGWKTGYKYFKAVLYDGDAVYKEQVIDMGNQ